MQEVEISVAYHLGGSVTVDHDLRSVSGNVFRNSSYSLNDVIFVLIFVWTLWDELREIFSAICFSESQMGSWEGYTSICPYYVRPRFLLCGCKKPRRRSAITKMAREAFALFAVSTEVDGDESLLLSRVKFLEAVESLGIHFTRFELQEVIATHPQSDEQDEWGMDYHSFLSFLVERGSRP